MNSMEIEKLNENGTRDVFYIDTRDLPENDELIELKAMIPLSSYQWIYNTCPARIFIDEYVRQIFHQVIHDSGKGRIYGRRATVFA